MVRRLLSLALLAGCWSEEPLVHDAFTPDQWAHLQDVFSPKEEDLPPTCDSRCQALAQLGQQLFFEPRLSGPWVTIATPTQADPDNFFQYPTGKTACATCHDAGTADVPGWFADVRPDNATSASASGRTKHNTISLVNVHVGHRDEYTWTGNCGTATMFAPCRSPTEVVDKIALKKAMQTKQDLVAFVIRSDSSYSALYATLFRAPIYDDDQTVLLNVELALDAYMQRLVSTDSRFDGFIAGDDTALDAQETRGFALFVGRGMCIECHTGWRFTDDKPRVTGVTDEVIDDGRDGSGAFHTPGLRNIAKTAPYMHNGLTGSLSDVIWFYRQGGGTTTFPKDPLMKKADLSDPEAADLEAFLVALTGTEIPYALRTDTHSQEPVACRHKNGKVDTLCGSACVDLVTDHDNCGKCGLKCGDQQVCMGQCYGPMACGPSLTMCATGCTNTQTDAAHCGSCGHACATGETCVAGTCTAAACPVGQQQCNGACIDVATDPANCGTCGNVCPPTTSCQAGSCQPLMCFPPTMACSNACVNVTNDTQNCGACGNICPPNKPSCVMGTCKP